MMRSDLRYICPIAGIYACRMLGLFLLIPVFSIYAKTLTDARPALIGIALGAYGLSQGLLQIPFGLLSDRWGRKPLIVFGLILFAIGSLMGALSHSIYGVILARILQGMGAIGSVLMALVSDVTAEQSRTAAMAMIGASIGLSFNLALVISPGLASAYGLSGIFYVTFGLAILGLCLLATIRTPHMSRSNGPQASWSLFRSVLLNPSLQKLNLGIFCQHFIFTATFFVLPLQIKHAVQTGILAQSWHFYLPTISIAFLLAVPVLMMVEKKGLGHQGYRIALLLTMLSQALLFWMQSSAFYYLWGILFFYFVAFNALEAQLPSLISKTAKPGEKGTAMGIYSSSQFLGIFAGGALAGCLAEYGSVHQIFLMNAALAAIWYRVSR